MNKPSGQTTLAERLRDAKLPHCRICGSVMTIASTDISGVTYACDGREGKWPNFKKGRSIADDHYSESKRAFRSEDQMELHYLEQAFIKAALEAEAADSGLAGRMEKVRDKVGALIAYQEMTVSMEKSRGSHPFLITRAEIALKDLQTLQSVLAPTDAEQDREGK